MGDRIWPTLAGCSLTTWSASCGTREARGNAPRALLLLDLVGDLVGGLTAVRAVAPAVEVLDLAEQAGPGGIRSK